MVISMALLSQAIETLPVGTAYAIWTGIGAVGRQSPVASFCWAVCLTGAFAQSWPDRRGYHWAQNSVRINSSLIFAANLIVLLKINLLTSNPPGRDGQHFAVYFLESVGVRELHR